MHRECKGAHYFLEIRMPNKPRSWTDEQLIQAVHQNITVSGTLRQLGLSTSPGNFRMLYKHIQRLTLETSHFLGQSSARGKAVPNRNSRPIQDLLVKGSDIPSNRLKKRLFHEGILQPQCILCGQDPEWRGQGLTLQLDHINGNHLDNRLENLRILCPNCHSQTETYTNRKGPGRYLIPSIEKESFQCLGCGCPIQKRSARCTPCNNLLPRATKIVWPSKEEILKMLESTNLYQLGKQLGVSDNAIRRHLNKK